MPAKKMKQYGYIYFNAARPLASNPSHRKLALKRRDHHVIKDDVCGPGT